MAQAGNHLHAILVGQVHNAVVLFPGALVPLVVPEVSACTVLDVLPGELLANPTKTGIADHLQRQLYLLRLDLLFQEGVYAERAYASM